MRSTKREQHGPLKRVTLLQPGERSEEVYDEWACAYEADLVKDYGYIAPQLAADAFERVCPDRSASVMDYGCGTGLVGQELARRGYTQIDGMDVSAGMLEEAHGKGVYRTLVQADLTRELQVATDCYDALICVGIFGNGHVTPRDVPAMARTAQPGAPFVIYLNDMAFTGEGYKEEFDRLEREGVWHVLDATTSNYMSELERPGWVVVTRIGLRTHDR